MKNWLLRHQLLLGILILAFAVRLYRLDYPLLDWHSWRQADTASVTQEYVEHGIDLLHPTYHDLSNIPSGKDNSTHGYRMVEFPILNAAVAWLFTHQSALSLVALSRLFSICLSMVTLVSLYVLSNALWNKRVGLATALTFAVLPYSIYYTRVVLPEPAVIAFSTASLAFFYYWLRDGKWWQYSGSTIGLMFALLLKPFAAFLAPVYVALILEKFGWAVWKRMKPVTLLGLLCFAPIAFAPLAWWRQWITQYPEGIPASDWLFNGNGIRFRPAWIRWLGYERLTKMIWGYLGLLFAVSSLRLPSIKKPDATLVFYAWWLSILSFFTVIATGNVQHDYYQVLTIPLISLTTGLGAVALHRWIHSALAAFSRTSAVRRQALSVVAVGLLYVGMLRLAWHQVGGFFNVNHWEYVTAGAAADRLLPPDAIVIAPAYGGDTGFLFQTNRRGWPIGFSIDDKIALGAQYYITTSYDDEAHELEQTYVTIDKNSTYLLLDLTRKKQP